MSAGSEGRGRIQAFRLVTRKFVASAFSGAGARLYGGRWNSVGTSMVYIAGSLSLAILEWRVHLAQWPPPAIAVIEVDLPVSLIHVPPKLPTNWERLPAPLVVNTFGDDWIKSAKSAVMRVPSAVVPGEWNYLLNPSHSDFSKLIVAKPRVLKPDPRLGTLY